MGRLRKALLAAIAALVLGALGAPGALASTVTVTGGNTVKVAETGNETNRIAVSYDSGTDLYTVADTASNLTPSGTCTMVDAHTATCPGAGIKTIDVDTDDRDDTIGVDGTVPSRISTEARGTTRSRMEPAPARSRGAPATTPSPAAEPSMAVTATMSSPARRPQTTSGAAGAGTRSTAGTARTTSPAAAARTRSSTRLPERTRSPSRSVRVTATMAARRTRGPGSATPSTVTSRS
jgi:hypothetical protein